MNDRGVTYDKSEWIENIPNMYSGEKGNEMQARWYNCFYTSDYWETFEMLNARNFHPGTIISIQEPECPECGNICPSGDDIGSDCECGFSWQEWIEHQFS